MGLVTLLDPPADERGAPAEILVVDRFRRAARAIVEAMLPASGVDGWPAQIVKLGVEMHAEPESIRGWAQRAVAEEMRELYGDDPEAGFDQAPTAAVIDPMLQLRKLGHETCPTCATPVPTFDEFHQWDGLRLLAAKRRDARKEATHVRR